MDFFCLSVPKFFVVDPSVFQKKPDSQQNLRKNDGAGITRFRRSYCFSLPETSQGNLSVL